MLELKHSQYFNKLPKVIQESIMQSGVDFENEEELSVFVSQLEERSR